MNDAPRIIPVGQEFSAMELTLAEGGARKTPHTAARSHAKAIAKHPAGKRGGAGSRGAAVKRRFGLLNAFIDSALSMLGKPELAAWLILYRHAKPDGTASASVNDLARRAGCCERTMRTALVRLQSRGLAVRLKRGTLAGGPSVWRLLTPEPSGTTGKILPVTTGNGLPV